jgi:ribosomal protein L32
MAVPKKKTSYQKSRSRRMANMKLKPVNFYLDESGNVCLPHRINSKGEYNGRQVFLKPEKLESKNSSDNSPSAIDHLIDN